MKKNKPQFSFKSLTKLFTNFVVHCDNELQSDFLSNCVREYYFPLRERCEDNTIYQKMIKNIKGDCFFIFGHGKTNEELANSPLNWHEAYQFLYGMAKMKNIENEDMSMFKYFEFNDFDWTNYRYEYKPEIKH